MSDQITVEVEWVERRLCKATFVLDVDGEDLDDVANVEQDHGLIEDLIDEQNLWDGGKNREVVDDGDHEVERVKLVIEGAA